MSERQSKPRRPEAEPDFHGAAIIDEQGREIPITESMVQRACEKLERAWHFPRAARPSC